MYVNPVRITQPASRTPTTDRRSTSATAVPSSTSVNSPWSVPRSAGKTTADVKPKAQRYLEEDAFGGFTGPKSSLSHEEQRSIFEQERAAILAERATQPEDSQLRDVDTYVGSSELDMESVLGLALPSDADDELEQLESFFALSNQPSAAPASVPASTKQPSVPPGFAIASASMPFLQPPASVSISPHSDAPPRTETLRRVNLMNILGFDIEQSSAMHSPPLIAPVTVTSSAFSFHDTSKRGSPSVAMHKKPSTINMSVAARQSLLRVIKPESKVP